MVAEIAYYVKAVSDCKDIGRIDCKSNIENVF